MANLKVASNNEIKIDRDIPLPRRVGNGGAPAKYPFDLLDVGDSFFVPLALYEPRVGDVTVKRLQLSLSAVMRNRRHASKKFATRSETAGVRVWRTA